MPHILITGASSGIGAALALHYAAPGVRLSLHGRSPERLDATAAEARRRGATVETHRGDVTDTAGMAAWIAAMDGLAPLTLVIANAGISGGTSGAEDHAEQIKKIFAVNWFGVLNTTHPAIRLMRSHGQGQVALMSSLAGFRGFAGAGAYGASKAAVRIYGEALRADLMPHGIKVNVICPGYVRTPMTAVNRFPMPFLIHADRAAQIIRKGLHYDRPRIAFPLPMYALVRFISMLPLDWVIRLTQGLPKKPVFDARE